MGLHETLRPESGRRFPDKRTRRIYMEQLDLVFRDYERILDQLEENSHRWDS